VEDVGPVRLEPVEDGEAVRSAAVLPGVGRVRLRRGPGHQRPGTGSEAGQGHGPPERHRWMTTGVPLSACANTRRSVSFGIRMHPFETARPIDHGAFVPWIAIGPPCVQPVSTFENAEMPTAPGPYGPLGSLGTRRWLT